jgi:hypothetical protein
MNQQLKRTLLSLAGLGVFLLLAFGSLDSTNENTSSSNRSSNSGSRSTNTDTTTYVNSKSDFTGKLEDNYVEFTFDYPNSWKRDPEAGKGSSPNFVKVEKTRREKRDRGVVDLTPVGSFAVGSVSGPHEAMPKLAGQFSDQFSGGCPKYQKVSEGETHVGVGSYDGYEFRFACYKPKSSLGEELYIWGRIVLLPSDKARKGVVLLMLATSASSDVHGPEDVGEKGELPIILNSFTFP